MKSDNNRTCTLVHKWSRTIHRDLSYFLAGMIIIYAISGLVMNHRRTFNPNYSVELKEYTINQPLPPQEELTINDILNLLAPLDETDNYTKHYFPQEGKMKVFLKGGSSLLVELTNGQAHYEKLTRRPLLSTLTQLHYNPGRWWTWFSDFFAIGLLIITITGLILVKGSKGLWGRGGIELAAGILIPLLFLFL